MTRELQAISNELGNLLALILKIVILLNKFSLLLLVVGVGLFDLAIVLIELIHQCVYSRDDCSLLFSQRLVIFTLAEGVLKADSDFICFAIITSLLRVATIDIIFAPGNLIMNGLLELSLSFQVLILKRSLRRLGTLVSCRCRFVQRNDLSCQIIELFLGIRNLFLALLVIISDLVLQRFCQEAFKEVDVSSYLRHVRLVLPHQCIVEVPELLLVVRRDDGLATSQAPVLDLRRLTEDLLGECPNRSSRSTDPGNLLPQEDHVRIIDMAQWLILRAIGVQDSDRLLYLLLKSFKPGPLSIHFFRDDLLLFLYFAYIIFTIFFLLAVDRSLELLLILSCLLSFQVQAVDLLFLEHLQPLVEDHPIPVILNQYLELS